MDTWIIFIVSMRIYAMLYVDIMLILGKTDIAKTWTFKTVLCSPFDCTIALPRTRQGWVQCEGC